MLKLLKKIFKRRENRTFLYEPYGASGDAVLLYFHKEPTSVGNLDSTWDMTGVDVPVAECREWHFWRQTETDDLAHDLTRAEMKEIKKYILGHKELVPNMVI